MTSKIFISHASEEHDLAEHIANYLESRKEYDFKAWYAPRDIRAGYDYDQEILRGIEQCRVFVLLLSAHSDASVHVKRELYDAVENGKRVICLEVERINPQNLRYLLGMKHRLNWLERRDETLDELIRNIIDEISEPQDQDKNFADDTENVNSSEISQSPEVSQTHEEVKVNASGKIFLSYTNSRRKSAVKIAEYLERSGLETWYASRDISAGVSHVEAVTSALRECRAVVLLLSKEADNSQIVESEIAVAVSNNKPVFCVKFDKFEPEKLKYFLADSKYFDTRKNYNEAINELVSALKGENKPEPPKPQKFSLKKFLWIAAVVVIAVIALIFARNEPKNYDIAALAEHGTPAEIREAVKAGVNFNNNSLFTAVTSNTPEAVKAIIEAGADVEARNELGENVLMSAAMYNTNPEMIKILLDAGANILWYADSEKGYGTAVFRAAQMNSNPDVVKVLLDAEDTSRRELLLNGTIRFGLTLLGWSATMNSWNPQIARFLVEQGANVNARNDYGMTALMSSSLAAYNPGTLKILIDAGADVNLQDNEGKTALMYAQHLPSAMSETLLEAGADPNIQDKKGVTALMIAAENCHSTIKSLINHGADVNIGDFFGRTAFNYAQENKNFDNSLLPLLIPASFYPKIRRIYDVFKLAEHGTSSDIRKALIESSDFSVLSEDENEEAITPLLIAARSNHDPEAVKLLLKADDGASQYLNPSPLFVAAADNTPEVIKVFLDAEGSSRRDLILKGKIRYRPEPETYEFMKDGIKLKRQEESSTLLMFARKIENVKFLLDVGADVNAKNEEGTTALIAASGSWGLPEVIKTLIDAGADVNAQDIYGTTALMSAAYHSIYTSFSDVVSKLEILIEAGANVNLQDNDGDTALILAAQRDYMEDRVTIIKTLINAGADKNIRNKFNKTAYDYALKNKRFDASLLPLLSPDVQPEKEN